MSDEVTPLSVSGGYIALPLTTSATALQAQAIAAIAALFPGWIPYEGQLDTALIEQFAVMASETALVAASVPLAIFQSFGSSIVNIPPKPGAPAGALSTWTMVDTQGYTVPAGTVVAYAVLGNQLVLFSTAAAFTVPSGATTATGVSIVAQTAGAAANGLAPGALSLVTALAFVESVVTTTTTSGGADPETLTAYLDRLSADLQLLGPHAVLPADFAALATNVAGVQRAVALNLLSPGRTITDATLNATSTLVDPAGSFTGADVGRSVTGNAGVPAGTTIAAYVSATQVTLSAPAGLSGINQTVVLGDLSNVERCVAVSAVDVDGNAVDETVQTALLDYLAGFREVNFILAWVPPTQTAIDVTFTATCLPGQDPSAVETAAAAAIESFLSPANWGGGAATPPTWDVNATVVRYLEVAAVLGDVTGMQTLDTLTIAIHGQTQGTANITLPGDAPLTAAGTISATVTAGV